MSQRGAFELMVQGRHLLYETPESFQAKIDEYFLWADACGKKYTVPGLCYFLGFEDRHSLATYEKRLNFSATARRARLKIEEQRAQDLVDPMSKNVNGIKFDLENNFGYREKHDLTTNENDINQIDISKLSVEEIAVLRKVANEPDETEV
jgi:hypothetical protein